MPSNEDYLTEYSAPGIELTRITCAAQRDGYAAGEAVYAHSWSGQNRPLPVDPFAIAIEYGVQMSWGRFKRDDIAGAAIRDVNSDVRKIVLEPRATSERLRFICAHELGHLVRHWHTGAAVEQYDYRSLVSSRATNGEEMYANSFALGLLMPLKLVKDRLRHGIAPWNREAVMALQAEFAVPFGDIRHRLVLAEKLLADGPPAVPATSPRT